MRFWLAGALALAAHAAPAWAAPITLDEAIAAAETHAPSLAMARAEADAADKRADAARAAGGPTATLTGSIGWGRLDPGGYFGLTATDVTPRAAQVGIEQPLFAGGRISGARMTARAGAEAAEAGVLQRRTTLRADVAQAFGGVLATQAGLQSASGLVKAVAVAANQAKLRFKAGEVPSTDVQQAEARLAEAEAVLANATGHNDAARARFRRLTGLSPDSLAALPGSPPLPATLDEAIGEAETRSPAIAQAVAGLAAARGQARMAKAEGLPQLAAYAEASSVRDQFFPGYRGDLASAGVRGRWNFFASGRIRAEGQAADATVHAAEARLADARGSVREMVIAAFANVRSTGLAAEAAVRQKRASEAALASVKQEVRVGLKPTLALLDAERDAAQSAMQAANADAQRIATAWGLRALLGRE
ncbi:TolC family protein [Sandarakinorhabdus sp.]|jgi:outer membrane protein|uniref:TolC family protein n=1 Tax=Sandarakinorhabdus sp. TaxID=1916663 RepID=UPI0028A942F1|nr:TolC family protein [Sandarakinorhabdus sp.]